MQSILTSEVGIAQIEKIRLIRYITVATRVLS